MYGRTTSSGAPGGSPVMSHSRTSTGSAPAGQRPSQRSSGTVTRAGPPAASLTARQSAPPVPARPRQVHPARATSGTATSSRDHGQGEAVGEALRRGERPADRDREEPG